MDKKHLLKNEPLAPYTTFKLGGQAKYFLATEDKEDLIECVLWAKKEKLPWHIFGGGSNTVFPDSGFKGVVIKYGGGELSAKNLAGTKINVDACVPLWKLVNFAIKNSLSGLEYLSGIPGNIGGAVVGDIEAYGHSFGRVVESVQIFDGQKIRQLANKDCHFGYRDSVFKRKNWIILTVKLKLKKGDKKELDKISRDLIQKRNEKYDRNILCAGSFFKNVPLKKVPKALLKKIDQLRLSDGNLPTGYLLEQVGARGLKVGGISVASFHSNFLINDGTGRTADLKKLASKLKSLVKRKFGIDLEEEVRVVN